MASRPPEGNGSLDEKPPSRSARSLSVLLVTIAAILSAAALALFSTGTGGRIAALKSSAPVHTPSATSQQLQTANSSQLQPLVTPENLPSANICHGNSESGHLAQQGSSEQPPTGAPAAPTGQPCDQQPVGLEKSSQQQNPHQLNSLSAGQQPPQESTEIARVQHGTTGNSSTQEAADGKSLPQSPHHELVSGTLGMVQPGNHRTQTSSPQLPTRQPPPPAEDVCGDSDPGQDGYAFHVPSERCFGREARSREACCEMFGELQGSSNQEVLQHVRYIVVGAMKAGTTFLFGRMMSRHDTATAHCGRHPDRQHKEVHWFDQPPLRGNDIALFENTFRQRVRKQLVRPAPAKMLADATPAYLRLPHVPCRIAKMWPGAKIVMILRDPVERAISQYLMEGRMGQLKSGVLLSSLVHDQKARLEVRQCTFRDPEGAPAPPHREQQHVARRKKHYSECYTCNEMWAAGVSGGCFDVHPDQLKGYFEDPARSQGDNVAPPEMEARNHHLLGGMYAPQLAGYLRFFPPRDIYVMAAENLRQTPYQELQKLAAFLGQDPAKYKWHSKDSHVRKNWITKQHEVTTSELGMTPAKVNDVEAMRSTLARFYYPLNQQLYHMLMSLGYDNFPRFGSDGLVAKEFGM